MMAGVPAPFGISNPCMMQPFKFSLCVYYMYILCVYVCVCVCVCMCVCVSVYVCTVCSGISRKCDRRTL